ncbi:hypothetical protein HHI36_012307, partial [Cryptolaemus montrouzieri]
GGRKSVGVIVPILERENEFAVAADRFLYWLKWNADKNNSGRFEQINMVEEKKTNNQFNDGKADAKGRLWIGESRVLFDLNEHRQLNGIPDGLTTDCKDNLWIALFGGHGIIHVDGISGKLLRYLKVPATYCTSVCFGGASREVLFVTTSNLKLTEEERIKEPNAGAVFAIRNLGVKGPAQYRCIL